eukprot:XP_024457574.1 pentatricopeptide repeat-containing protein At3g50420-like [Populus trichocarpa]
MPQRNIVSYNALISAFSRDSNHGFLSLKLFALMGTQGLTPNGSTFSSSLQACCLLEDWFMGSLIHGQSVKHGFFNDVFVQTSLLGMYSNCGDLESANKVFGCVVQKDAVLWNSMIFGNLKNEKLEEGVLLFGKLVRHGIVPTEFTYSMILNACGKLGDCRWGQVIHAQVIVLNVLADLPLQNALLDMYCSCGDTETGFNVFNKIENPDLVSWNSMISGYAENGEGADAMNLFLQLVGVFLPKPDEYTFAAVISATSAFSATCYGKPLHASLAWLRGLRDNFSLPAAQASARRANAAEADTAAESADTVPRAATATAPVSKPALHKSAPPIFPAGGMAATAPMSRPAVLSVKPWTVQSRDPGNAACRLCRFCRRCRFQHCPPCPNQHWAESQWIVAARPLCHLQYPVAYLSRLQRILPAARWELYFKAARAALSPRGLGQRHVPPGPRGPYCRSAIGRRAHASHLARILT